MKRKKTINYIASVNIFCTIFLQGIIFVSAPIFSRMLGSGNYGTVSVYSTWVSLTSIVFSLNVGGSITIAKSYFPEDKQKDFQSSIYSLILLLYLGLSVITLIISRFLGLDNSIVIILLSHGLGSCFINSLSTIFSIELNAVKNLIFTVSLCLSEVTLSLFLVASFDDGISFLGRIYGGAIISIIYGFFSFFYVFFKGKCVFDKRYWLFALPITIPSTFHLLSNMILAQSDRVMLDSMLGNSYAGLYSLASNFSSILIVIYSSLNITWVPFFYKYMKDHDLRSIQIHSKHYLEVYTILICGFMLLSREVFSVFGGTEYVTGCEYIPILSIGSYFVFLYSFPVNYEFYNKKTIQISVVSLSAAVCNIVLNYLLINKFFIWGAVISTVISYGLQFLFHFISAKFFIPGSFPFHFKNFIPYIFVVVSFCAITFKLKDYWVLRWIIGVLMGVVLLYRIYRRKGIF